MQEFYLSFGIILLAIFLGIKHAFDADHLVAVSSLLTRTESVKRAALLSTSWSFGHMVTATFLTIIFFTFKDTIFRDVFNNIELLVPLMLIFIGVVTIAYEFNLLHFHRHTHTNEDGTISKDHKHLHTHSNKQKHGAMMGIGLIHGIASNDELLLLFTLTFGVNTLAEILVGVGIFTIGVVGGMIFYSYSLNFPIRKFGSKKVLRVVNVTVGVLSIAYAFYLIAGLEGLNIISWLGITA